MSLNLAPNRRYPIRYGSFCVSAFVTDVEHASGVVSYYQVPFGLAGETALRREPRTVFEASVRRGLEYEIERFSNVLRVTGVSADDRTYYEEQLARFKGIREGRLPPEETLFDAIGVELVVEPSEQFSVDASGRDFWDYLDAVTGGCCNARYDLGGGGAGYEISMYGVGALERILADPMIGRPVALTLTGPVGLLERPDVPEVVRKLSSTVPTIAEMREVLACKLELGTYGFVPDPDPSGEDPRTRYRSDRYGVYLFVPEGVVGEGAPSCFSLESLDASETEGWSSATVSWSDVKNDLDRIAPAGAKVAKGCSGPGGMI